MELQHDTLQKALNENFPDKLNLLDFKLGGDVVTIKAENRIAGTVEIYTLTLALKGYATEARKENDFTYTEV